MKLDHWIWLGPVLAFVLVIGGATVGAVIWENQRTSCWVKGGSLSFYGQCRMSSWNTETKKIDRWIEAP